MSATFSCWIWTTNVPRKILVFGWRFLLNKLPTREALSFRGIFSGSNSLGCPLCSIYSKTILHLFFDCFLAFQVWEQIYKWMKVPFQFELDASGTNFSSLIFLLKGRVHKSNRLLVWLAVCWAIWLSRNEVVFQQVVVRAGEVVDRAKVLAWKWFTTRTKDAYGLIWS